MIRREGRLDHQALETGGHGRTVVLRRWERPALLIAAIAILILGVVVGLNAFFDTLFR